MKLVHRSGRAVRRLQLISKFDFLVLYKKGNLKKQTDALCREAFFEETSAPFLDDNCNRPPIWDPENLSDAGQEVKKLSYICRLGTGINALQTTTADKIWTEQ